MPRRLACVFSLALLLFMPMTGGAQSKQGLGPGGTRLTPPPNAPSSGPYNYGLGPGGTRLTPPPDAPNPGPYTQGLGPGGTRLTPPPEPSSGTGFGPQSGFGPNPGFGSNSGSGSGGYGPSGGGTTYNPGAEAMNTGHDLFARGRHADAEASFRRALEFRPGDPSALLNIAMAIHKQAREFDRAGNDTAATEKVRLAIDAYREAIRHGARPIARENLEALQKVLRQWEAVEARRKRDDAFMAAYRLLDERRWSEGETAFRRYVASYPDDAAAQFNVGLALEMQRKYEVAVTAYEKALTLTPSDGKTQRRLQAVRRSLELTLGMDSQRWDAAIKGGVVRAALEQALLAAVERQELKSSEAAAAKGLFGPAMTIKDGERHFLAQRIIVPGAPGQPPAVDTYKFAELTAVSTVDDAAEEVIGNTLADTRIVTKLREAK